MRKTLFLAILCALLPVQSCVKNENIVPNLPPSEFSIEEEEHSLDHIRLDWSDAFDPEETPITYQVWLGGEKVVSELTDSEFLLEDLAPGTTYLITIFALDAEGESTKVREEVRTDEAPVPSAFTLEQSAVSVNSARITWEASTAAEGLAVTYDVYLDDVQVASDITELEYTFEDLDAITPFTAKVVAKTVYDSSVVQTLEFVTDGNHVLFGEPNRPVGQALSESDFGIIELPVLVRDAGDLNPAEAVADIRFGFTIDGNVNERDYELLTPSPLIIAKGSAMGTIKIRILADDYQEFPYEYLIVRPNFVENGRYSGLTEVDGVDLDPRFVLLGLDYDWLQEAPDAYSAAISWSNPGAEVSAALYKESATTGNFTKVAHFGEGLHPLRFELDTTIDDGNYYLELVRGGNTSEALEASVYVTVPDALDQSLPNLATVKNLTLDEGSAQKVVFDIQVENGVYTFTSNE